MTGDLTAAVAALHAGLVVGVPTDTVYGIAANPMDAAAVGRLFAAKGRPPDRAIPILVAGVEHARRVGVLGDAAAAAASGHWPGPLTLVVPRAAGLPEWVGDPAAGTVGIRMPDHPVALGLLAAFGPLAVTSANRSGEPPAGGDAEAAALLGEAVAVYLPGSGCGGASSTVVDLTGPSPKVLRPGPIEWEVS